MPDGQQVRRLVSSLVGPVAIDPNVVDAAVVAFQGLSFSDIERDMLRARREAVVLGETVEERLAIVLSERVKALPHAQQIRPGDRTAQGGAFATTRGSPNRSSPAHNQESLGAGVSRQLEKGDRRRCLLGGIACSDVVRISRPPLSRQVRAEARFTPTVRRGQGGDRAKAVGACDSVSLPWARAHYSSLGPGRSPGRIKPDLLAIGGIKEDPYVVLSRGRLPRLVPIWGRSFAAPTALRVGLGIRAHLGRALSPLAIKALLTHRSEQNYEKHIYGQHGWGRNRTEIEEMRTCPDDTVHVVYQGMLRPRQCVRAKIPVPQGTIPGKVHLAITLCIASATDPEHPPSYTRNGIDAIFRPHMARFTGNKDGEANGFPATKQPKSRSLFSRKPYMSETELRDDAHKWETTLSAFASMLGTSLSDIPLSSFTTTPGSAVRTVYSRTPSRTR